MFILFRVGFNFLCLSVPTIHLNRSNLSQQFTSVHMAIPKKKRHSLPIWRTFLLRNHNDVSWIHMTILNVETKYKQESVQ